jgi:glycerol uptake facilitator-like aquaporin
MTATQGLAIEFGCTFAVFLTAFACMDEARAQHFPHIKVLAPLVIGQAVTAVLFVGIPVDTCSINPSRTIAVALVSGEWDDIWVVSSIALYRSQPGC